MVVKRDGAQQPRGLGARFVSSVQSAWMGQGRRFWPSWPAIESTRRLRGAAWGSRPDGADFVAMMANDLSSSGAIRGSRCRRVCPARNSYRLHGCCMSILCTFRRDVGGSCGSQGTRTDVSVDLDRPPPRVDDPTDADRFVVSYRRTSLPQLARMMIPKLPPWRFSDQQKAAWW